MGSSTNILSLGFMAGVGVGPRSCRFWFLVACILKRVYVPIFYVDFFADRNSKYSGFSSGKADFEELQTHITTTVLEFPRLSMTG